NLDEAANLASGMASGLAQAVRRHFVMPLWRFAFQEHAIATYLEDMQAVLDRARALVETRRLLQDGSSLDSPPFLAPPTGFADWGKKLISSTTIPALEKAMSKAFVGMVQRSLLETDIALSRFRKRHGRYPESLERLVPEFLPELPVDAIDGKPLRYRLDPNRPDPLLWSVGENGTDEGGDPTPRAEGLTVNHHWWRGKDAVWPRPATSEEIAEWHSREQNTRGRIMGSKASSGSSNAFVMSPELMRRYGLIPASPPSPPPTNSPRGPTTR
ncbi:MAG: hypothetical protein JNL97_08675, partial [Verrucomicrobiales bacterium]|nr:hypothetical protein [Verrucomicrobiales bacterium]